MKGEQEKEWFYHGVCHFSTKKESFSGITVAKTACQAFEDVLNTISEATKLDKDKIDIQINKRGVMPLLFYCCEKVPGPLNDISAVPFMLDTANSPIMLPRPLRTVPSAYTALIGTKRP